MDSLQSKILTGDREAFKEWMTVHIQAIERLAVQYGLTPQDAGKLAESVFRKLFNDLGHLTEEQLEENTLFNSALKKVGEFQVETSEAGLFSFEEDNELHALLIGLPKEERIAFILSSLHDKSQDDIAWIMETPLENVKDLLRSARAKLDRPDIEKRLEFLNRSFHRLRPSYNERNIFYSTPKEASESDEPVKIVSRRRKPLLMWLAGVVMLVLILSVTVLRSDAYQQSSAEKFIENKKIAFQKELEDRYQLMGLPLPDDTKANQDFYFYGNIYGNETSRQFNLFTRELERQVESKGKINKKEATEKYGELIHELRLPSEMLEQLKNEPLVKDREKSMEFLNEFAQKNDFLSNAYMGVFGEHSDIVFESELFSDGMVDIEEFMKKKTEFPIELQNAINGMETQFYSLAAIKDYMPLSLKYENPEVKKTLQQNLHLDMEAYIFLITGGLDILYYGTFGEKMEVLLELDKQLPKTRESDPLVSRFDYGYSWLVYSIAGFFDGDGIYDQNMVVREEVRGKWKQLASIGGSSSAGLVMKEFVDEMEASDWKVLVENDIQMHAFERIGDKIKEARKRR
ncbi:RNA polymerase sigma factor [Sporosarcina koreensis]|uniref:RNA polymerase sigma factor n=1 Tax=Sporosarcina koreensis TaxID=334735 RepID=A0ABW0TT29_9BACL